MWKLSVVVKVLNLKTNALVFSSSVEHSSN